MIVTFVPATHGHVLVYKISMEYGITLVLMIPKFRIGIFPPFGY